MSANKKVVYNLQLMWRNALVVIPWTSFLYIGYQLTNWFHLLEPQYLPSFAFEEKIPFMAWTVIPYFLLVGGMYLPILLHSRKLLIQSMLALTVTVLINYTIFALFPTIMQRPPMPTGDSLSELCYRWLISIDSPANCFPSGHISVPAIGCWYLMKERSALRGKIITIVYALLALTVLTTKQHYAIDILGGLITATIGIITAYFLIKKIKIKEYKIESTARA